MLDSSPPGDLDKNAIDEPVGKAGDKIFSVCRWVPRH